MRVTNPVEVRRGLIHMHFICMRPKAADVGFIKVVVHERMSSRESSNSAGHCLIAIEMSCAAQIAMTTLMTAVFEVSEIVKPNCS